MTARLASKVVVVTGALAIDGGFTAQ